MPITKKKLTIALPILLLMFLVSTAMLSGTFARYASSYAGQDTALVARWSFSGTVDDDPITETLPIWDHDYVTNIYTGASDPLIAPGVKGSFAVGISYNSDVDAALTLELAKSGNADDAVPLQYSLDSNFATVYYDLDALETAVLGALDTASTSISLDAGTYKIANTGETETAVTAGATVYWRWPYLGTAHNGLTDATAGVAADRTAAGFAGTGALIKFPADTGSDTTYHAWTDADDTAIGTTLAREDYVLTVTVTATQLEPAE